MRLFFALWPDNAVRAALAAAGCALVLRDGRAEPAAQLHLTLRFLGDVAPTQLASWRRVAAAVVAPRFSLHIAQAGWWRCSEVAWLAPREVPAALFSLFVQLSGPAAAGDAPFRPHVTVARRVRRVPGLAQDISVVWPVRTFALISSDPGRVGARYEVLERWPLGTRGPR